MSLAVQNDDISQQSAGTRGETPQTRSPPTCKGAEKDSWRGELKEGEMTEILKWSPVSGPAATELYGVKTKFPDMPPDSDGRSAGQ